MNTTSNLSKFYGDTFNEHSQLPNLAIGEIVEYIHSQFPESATRICLHDDEAIEGLIAKIKSHNDLTNSALQDHDLRLLRKGIADQLAAVYSFMYSVDGLEHPSVNYVSLLVPHSYADYCNAVSDQLDAFIGVEFMWASTEDVQLCLDLLVANLMNLPACSEFSIKSDFVDMAFSKLSGKEPYLSYIKENSIWK